MQAAQMKWLKEAAAFGPHLRDRGAEDRKQSRGQGARMTFTAPSHGREALENCPLPTLVHCRCNCKTMHPPVENSVTSPQKIKQNYPTIQQSHLRIYTHKN